MKDTVEKINQLLTRWNPIGVPDDIAKDEYRGYISLILQNIENRQTLITCMENILTNMLGLDYDSTSKRHQEDLQSVCDELMIIYQGR